MNFRYNNNIRDYDRLDIIKAIFYEQVGIMPSVSMIKGIRLLNWELLRIRILYILFPFITNRRSLILLPFWRARSFSFSPCKQQKVHSHLFCSRICTYNYQNSSRCFVVIKKFAHVLKTCSGRSLFFYTDESIKYCAIFLHLR